METITKIPITTLLINKGYTAPLSNFSSIQPLLYLVMWPGGLVRTAAEANSILSYGQAEGQEAPVVQLLYTCDPMGITWGCRWRLSVLHSIMKIISPNSQIGPLKQPSLTEGAADQETGTETDNGFPLLFH